MQEGEVHLDGNSCRVPQVGNKLRGVASRIMYNVANFQFDIRLIDMKSSRASVLREQDNGLYNVK
jgi:hypothetical protein